ncbi:hypothetical protein EX30DRAFT_43314 [Ascodesmis nigricans]|uniref:Uncharacterized protein n=1 Tax=Ascodesmis nigricans TaxID=341454 RepID=A0A4S2MWF6_9PEZI|nr:hypothetical protein EX30DRAFT_43314 [Ascodesmis nigricans]
MPHFREPCLNSTSSLMRTLVIGFACLLVFSIFFSRFMFGPAAALKSMAFGSGLRNYFLVISFFFVLCSLLLPICHTPCLVLGIRETLMYLYFIVFSLCLRIDWMEKMFFFIIALPFRFRSFVHCIASICFRHGDDVSDEWYRRGTGYRERERCGETTKFS